MSDGNAHRPSGSGVDPNAARHLSSTNGSSNRSGLFVATLEREGEKTKYTFHHVDGRPETTCLVNPSRIISPYMAVRQGQLFVAHAYRHVLVHDLSVDDAEARELLLDGVMGVTLFDSDIYAYGIRGELFVVDGAAEEMALKHVAYSPVDHTDRMFIMRKTSDRFEFAVDAIFDGVFIVSKHENERETSDQIGDRDYRLAGSHDDHVFMTVLLDVLEVEELVDFFDGGIVRRWSLEGVSYYNSFVYRTQFYYATGLDEGNDSDEAGNHVCVRALDLDSGRTTTLFRTARCPLLAFVPFLN